MLFFDFNFYFGGDVCALLLINEALAYSLFWYGDCFCLEQDMLTDIHKNSRGGTSCRHGTSSSLAGAVCSIQFQKSIFAFV